MIRSFQTSHDRTQVPTSVASESRFFALLRRAEGQRGDQRLRESGPVAGGLAAAEPVSRRGPYGRDQCLGEGEGGEAV